MTPEAPSQRPTPTAGPSRPRSLEDMLKEVREEAQRKTNRPPAPPSPYATSPVNRTPAPTQKRRVEKRAAPAPQPAQPPAPRAWAPESDAPVPANVSVEAAPTVDGSEVGLAQTQKTARLTQALQSVNAPTDKTLQWIDDLRAASPENKRAVARQAIIAHEIFGPPRAFRPHSVGALPPCRR